MFFKCFVFVCQQSTEYLAQALNLSLLKGLHAEAADAAFDLTECCGVFDPISASQFLALHQSCLASVKLYETFLESQRDPSLSKQAALVQTRHLLLAVCLFIFAFLMIYID